MENLRKKTAILMLTITSILIAIMVFCNTQPIMAHANELLNTKINRGEEILKDTDKSEIVNIPDDNLKKVLNKALHKYEYSDITKAELERIEFLNILYGDINNIEGLQYCTNLKALNIMDTNIGNISVLSELKNLKTLRLNNTGISDISPLSELKNLLYLMLSGNQISDISPLIELKNLEDLGLDYNEISDISVLSELKN